MPQKTCNFLFMVLYATPQPLFIFNYVHLSFTYYVYNNNVSFSCNDLLTTRPRYTLYYKNYIKDVTYFVIIVIIDYYYLYANIITNIQLRDLIGSRNGTLMS
ncbi:hypothetical protein BDC45DRAFT_537293 [Circinella umbellata]|nr:hypothetical protein BDC45DRAFT_537293 [Circinella umbellata]